MNGDVGKKLETTSTIKHIFMYSMICEWVKMRCAVCVCMFRCGVYVEVGARAKREMWKEIVKRIRIGELTMFAE